MYDINTKNVKKGIKFYLVFLLVGIIFLAIILSIVLVHYFKLKKLDGKVMSTSVSENSYYDEDDGNLLYSPIYYYTVDGSEYQCKSNSSSSIRPGNENKMVYYDIKNPSNCMTEYSKKIDKILLIVSILPLLFIIIALFGIIKIMNRLKKIKYLNKYGKLIKNVPFHLENTGMEVNNNPIQRPVIEYTLPDGSIAVLYGDARHDGKLSDADNLVDIIIDPNDPNNYFIDYEINRLTGNLKDDYLENNNSVYLLFEQVKTKKKFK